MPKKLIANLFSTCSVAVLLALNAPVAAAQTAAAIDIPAQPLADALRILGKRTDTNILIDLKLVKDLQSPAIKGQMTAGQALTKLLAGTNLRYQFIDERTVVLKTNVETATPLTPSTSVGGAGETDLLSLASTFQLALAETAETAGDKVSSDKKTSGKSSDDVEEMIVEESKIKIFANSNADIPRTVNDVQPYYIFDSETIEMSGALNIDDFLKQRLTMNTTAVTQGHNTGAFGQGTFSSIDLRGLGADKTLILVNGRRVAGTTNGSSTTIANLTQPDLNGYPMSAIDRIEVLPSSSSGIYGGGAVAGVINVILKKNYTGGELRASFDNTWDTDAGNSKVSGSYGSSFAGGKTNILISGQWSTTNALALQDRRELIDRGLGIILRNDPAFIYSSTNPFMGSLTNITSTSERINNVLIPDPGTLTLKNGTALGSRFTHISAGISSATQANLVNADLLRNAGAWNMELPASYLSPTGLLRALNSTPTVKSMMLSITQRLGNSVRATLDITHNENVGSYLSAPQSLPNSLTMSVNHPLNPFNSAILVRYPFAASGTNERLVEVDSANVGMTMDLPRGWVAQFDYTWSHNRSLGLWESIDSTAYNRDMNNGVFNPLTDTLLNPWNVDQYRYKADSDTESYAKIMAVRGSGKFLALPWGTSSLTAGLEHRIADIPGGTFMRRFPISTAEDYSTTFFRRKQTTDSIYAEMLVPLVKQGTWPLLYALEWQVSGRSERYTVDSGTSSFRTMLNTGVITYNGTTLNGRPYFSRSSYASQNSTMGFKYQPLQEFTVRASLASAFLPPTAEQLIKNPIPNQFPTTINDPRNNNAQFDVATISGGNPDLTPQNSKSLNAGVIWEPSWERVAGLRLNAEYYRIRQFDVISGLGTQDLVNNEFNYPGRVTRDASGRIVLVDTSLVNLYGRETEGWDFSADYLLKTKFGSFNLRLAESHILHLKEQTSFTTPENDLVGLPSLGGAAAKKANLQAIWNHRNWVASWAARYFDSYQQYNFYYLAQGATTIPSQTYHDMHVGYTFARQSGNRTLATNWSSSMVNGLSMQLGVKNVFNTLPPYDVNYSFYSSPYGDKRLRSYWLSLKKNF